MMDWFTSLWSTDGFVPRKLCGAWTPEWVGLHTASDILIWLAYLSIPLVLLAVARHRAVRPFRLLVFLFAAFIVSCGTVHLIEALIFEYPVYRLSGVVKGVTAVVSWVTVFALVPLLRRVLPLLDSLPTTPPADPDAPPDADQEADRPRAMVYSLAVLVGLLSVLVRFALDPVLGEMPALGVSLLGVIFIAWYGGFGPGLVTLLISATLMVYLFFPPRYSLLLTGLDHQLVFGVYMVTGMGVLVLGELQRRTRQRLYAKMAQLRAATAALAGEKAATDRALAQLDALVRNAPYSIAFLDHELRPVRVNGTFAEANRMAVEDHFGRRLPELLPDMPSDLLTQYHEVLAGGPPVVGRLVHGDGRMWEVSAFRVPLDDDHGGLGVIGQDVTDRQAAAEQLRESEQRFRQLADAMPQIVYVNDPDGRMDYINRQWVEYTGRADARPETVAEVIHPDDLPALGDRWQRALADGTPMDAEFRLRRAADSSYRWFLTRAVPVRDADGRVEKWYGTSTDIDDQKRLQLDLREARRFSESVLHSLPGHLAVIDADGRILSVNESWRQFGVANGQPPDLDWTTSNYFDACRREEYGERAAAGIRAVAKGERGAFEMEYPCHGAGVERHFLLRANRFRGDGPVRLVITHENITERVVAERQVREAASQLAQLTEGVPLLMWACQPTGECDYLSRQWLDYTGRGLVEQLGYGWLDGVHPEDRESTAAAWRKAVEAGGGFDQEYRLRRHDGVYRWFAVRGIPLRDQAGRVVRWFGSCTDVDDRVQHEELLGRQVEERTLALQEQKIFLNAILDNVAEGIVACDADGHLQLFNAATRRIHGLPADPLPAERWSEHYQLFQADGVTPMPTDRVPLVRAWRGEQVDDVELVVRAVGQSERYLRCFGQQLRGDDGRVFGAVVSMRDMTNQREYERELVRTADALRVSNQELEKFAYIASHDLQEPLRKIQAFGNRLADKFREAVGEQGKDYIDRMLDSAGRMRQLIEDLLAFSRVTTKGGAFVPVNLNAVARDVLSDLEERVTRSGGLVQVGPLPTVPGDLSQLRQLFLNLIGNALKFANPSAPPVVQVSAVPFDQLPADVSPRPSGPGWRITVADNGIGFDPRYADRIFELFQRLHGRGEYEGTGLGLAIVRKIVLRHGATISAHSREGHGAEFVIDWPTHEASDPAPRNSSSGD